MTLKNDLLTKLLYEAKSYNTFDDIEKLVEVGSDLSVIPIQPLYISLISTSSDQIAQVIPKLSSEQRQALLDLDLWKRDKVDVQSFELWIEAYSKVEDLEITQEFVESEDFLLYLKSRVNVHTFDTDDPMYPDNDYYFLTDDMLLLIEYSEEYRYPNELRYLIRNLYDKLGVENAYSLLFKLINDSFSLLQESSYQRKKERLREFGFVDYYEALEKLYHFPSVKRIENFVKNKDSLTPNIEVSAQNQSLHSSALVSFDQEMENILKELSKVTDTARLHFLHFTFIRLINSTITLQDALKGGRLELTRIGKVTRTYLELGLQFIHRQLGPSERVIFDQFDFFDLYKIGKSLINLEREACIRALNKSPFEAEDYESFLGAWWCSFLENNDNDIPKVKSYGAALHSKQVENIETYEFWKKEIALFINSLPFINSFFETYSQLKADGKLHDEFYLNYEVENIDFEAILISSFINFSLGNFSTTDVNKMGVTISELKKFFSLYFEKIKDEFVLKDMNNDEINQQIEQFLETFGFAQIEGMSGYLHGVLSEHLSGYDFDTLEDADYMHIGGPILLNHTTN